MSMNPIAQGCLNGGRAGIWSAFMLLASVLFLFTPFSFSYYISPPFSIVAANNSAALAGIQASYLNSLVFGTPSFIDPFESAGGAIVAAFPSVDGRISAGNQTKILWVWAESHADSVKETNAADGCNDQIDFLSSSVSGTMEFKFRNMTRVVAIDASQFEIPVPFSSDELTSMDYRDSLIVSLHANVLLDYEWKVREEVCSGASCYCSTVDTETRQFSRVAVSSANMTVESGTPLFIMVRPILKEQWFMNNKFDSVLLSRRSLYRGSVFINGQEFGNFSFRQFNIADAGYGLRTVISIQNGSFENSSASESVSHSEPYPLEQSQDSFSFAYQVNSSYSGLGLNYLSLEVLDDFGNKFRFVENISSRKLSYNGSRPEDGIPTGASNLRPSYAPAYGDYELVLAASAVIGLIIFFALFRGIFSK